MGVAIRKNVGAVDSSYLPQFAADVAGQACMSLRLNVACTNDIPDCKNRIEPALVT